MKQNNLRKKRHFLDEREETTSQPEMSQMEVAQNPMQSNLVMMPEPTGNSPQSHEPYVSADVVAQHIDETPTNVVKMARQKKITSYAFTGRVRHRYKFKLSEVERDLARYRSNIDPWSEAT